MPQSVVIAGLVPHPPIIIPEIGRGDESQALDTVNAMNLMGQKFSDAQIDTLVIITPHGPTFSDAVSMPISGVLKGDFKQFGERTINVKVKNDVELVNTIIKQSKGAPVHVVPLDRKNYFRYQLDRALDHGTLVPLYFLLKAGFSARIAIVNIGFLPYLDLYRFGKTITQAASLLGRKIGVLASGDLSHSLKPGAPAGYNEQGKIFDQRLIKNLESFSVKDVLCMPQPLISNAAECGLRPISIMLGTLDQVCVQPEVLSYEGPFGVGYCVSIFKPVGKRKSRLSGIMRQKESFPVSIARLAVERFVQTTKFPELGIDIPSQFARKAGVFVTIYKGNTLRGCIGTIEPVTESIVNEIIQNAVSAATRDYRFSPVRIDELDKLNYNVDILSKPVQIKDLSELDPKKYGIICEKDNKRGLLLPDLPGVDTVKEQLSIAKQKAGIVSNDNYIKIYRFTVKRYS